MNLDARCHVTPAHRTANPVRRKNQAPNPSRSVFVRARQSQLTGTPIHMVLPFL